MYFMSVCMYCARRMRYCQMETFCEMALVESMCFF